MAWSVCNLQLVTSLVTQILVASFDSHCRQKISLLRQQGGTFYACGCRRSRGRRRRRPASRCRGIAAGTPNRNWRSALLPGRARLPELRRTADLVFRKAKVAVFVDGCYWHGCPEHHTQPATNSEYWSNKITGNIARDQDTDAHLQEAGWTVLRFWEHEDAATVADAVEQTVRAALRGRGTT